MFIKRPSDVVEGTVKEVRVAYDEYGVVSVQQAPLDGQGFNEVEAVEVFEAAIRDLTTDGIVEEPKDQPKSLQITLYHHNNEWTGTHHPGKSIEETIAIMEQALASLKRRA